MDAGSTGAPSAPVDAGVATEGGADFNAQPEAHRAPKGPDGKFRQVQDVADAAARKPEASQGGAGETAAQAAARRKLELKINGEVRTAEFDEGTLGSLAELYGVTPEELTATLQRSVAGHRALSEAAKERRAIAQQRAEVEQRLERLRQAPDEVLAELGVDPDELALRRLQEAARREAMSPEQVELMERERQLAAREQKLQQIEQQRQQQAQKAAEEEAFRHAQETLVPALEASGLPKNHATLSLLADVGESMLDAGLELTPEALAQEARAIVMERTQSVLRDMKPAQLVQVLGKDLVRALMKHTVEQSRSSLRPPAPQPTQQPRQQEDSEPEFISPAQALRGW